MAGWFLESDTVYSAVRECQERLVGSVKKTEEDPGGETSNPQNSWKEKESSFIAYDASIVFLPVSIALLFQSYQNVITLSIVVPVNDGLQYNVKNAFTP